MFGRSGFPAIQSIPDAVRNFVPICQSGSNHDLEPMISQAFEMKPTARQLKPPPRSRCTPCRKFGRRHRHLPDQHGSEIRPLCPSTILNTVTGEPHPATGSAAAPGARCAESRTPRTNGMVQYSFRAAEFLEKLVLRVTRYVELELQERELLSHCWG
jgi:hypothetical protein